jgi:hypothetical protein
LKLGDSDGDFDGSLVGDAEGDADVGANVGANVFCGPTAMHVPLSHAQSEKSGGVPSWRMELKSVDEYLDWAGPLSLPLTTVSTTTSILRTQASISIESNVNTSVSLTVTESIGLGAHVMRTEC